jgi:putative endonuclease
MIIHVYMLRCSDGSYYTGIAREGLLVWSDESLKMTEAIACERQIKGWSRATKEALIRGDYNELSQHSHSRPGPHPSTSSG